MQYPIQPKTNPRRFEVSSLSDIPTEPHYAIMYTSTYSESTGWDREGYSSTGTKLNYIAFLDREEWEKEVAIRKRFPEHGAREHIIALAVNPAKIETEIKVTVR